MGLVVGVEKHPRDGLVRTLDVKMKNRVVKRAVQKVILLVAAFT